MIAKKILPVVLMWFALAPALQAEITDNPIVLTEEIEAKGLAFIQALRSAEIESVYASLDPEMRAMGTPQELKSRLGGMQSMLAGMTAARLVDQQYDPGRADLIWLVYEVTIEDVPYLLTVTLKKSHETFSVVGYNFNDKPRALFDLSRATPFHRLIFALFVACVIAQLVSALFFITRKNLPKKWLYVLTSVIGFPVGIKMNWTTGAYLLQFGFKLPAVSAFASSDNPGIWLVTVYFPAGLLVMLYVALKKGERPRLAGTAA